MIMKLTTKEIKKLKKLYNKAVEQETESFMFNGHEILTAYAKYLLEYLEEAIKKRR